MVLCTDKAQVRIDLRLTLVALRLGMIFLPTGMYSAKEESSMEQKRVEIVFVRFGFAELQNSWKKIGRNMCLSARGGVMLGDGCRGLNWKSGE